MMDDDGPPNGTHRYNGDVPPHNDNGPPHNDDGWTITSTMQWCYKAPHNDDAPPHDDAPPPHDYAPPPHDDAPWPPHNVDVPPHNDNVPPHNNKMAHHTMMMHNWAVQRGAAAPHCSPLNNLKYNAYFWHKSPAIAHTSIFFLLFSLSLSLLHYINGVGV